MAAVLTAKEVCERALRMCRVYSINDSAADPEHLLEALRWFDMIMAHLSGRTEIRWLVPATIAVPLTASTASYDLLNTMGQNAPADGFNFPLTAQLDDGTDNRSPIDVISRFDYDTIANQAQSGRPEVIYIDRLAANPLMKVWPVPAADDDDFTIYLTVQTFSPTVAPTGVTGHAGQGNILTKLHQTWNLWAATELAATIGDGPVARRPEGEIDRWKATAKELREDLLAFDATEHTSDPPRTAFHDL